METDNYKPEEAKKILEHNGLTISPEEMQPLQMAAMNSLQELEFIVRIQDNHVYPRLIREIAIFAGPQIRSAPAIAETPRQLLVLCNSILERVKEKPENPEFITLVSELRKMQGEIHNPPVTDTSPLQLNALYRGKDGQLLRPEKSSELKAEVEKVSKAIPQHPDSDSLVKLLSMLSESLAANHNRQATMEIAR